MFGLNNYRIGSLIVGIAGVMILTGGNVRADFTFGEPMNLGPTVNTSSDDNLDFFSADGLEMYITSSRPGGYGSWDLWVSRRSTICLI